LKALAAGAAAIPALVYGPRSGDTAGPPASPTSLPRRFGIPGLAADGIQPGPSLREKIGEMVISGFDGLSVSPSSPVGMRIAQRKLGGVILFAEPELGAPSRNIESPDQLRALTRQLRSLDTRSLFIGVDEEGGQVARLSPTHGFPATYSAGELGRRDDPAFTYAAGANIAATLRDAGINLNFAPVVDLNVNPNNPVIAKFDRSFSADPNVVTRNAEAFIRAHRDAGILTTLKHFPGHGSSLTDSHAGFTDITNTWSSVELQPFANIIRDGLADMVLVGHLFNAHLDAHYPATLSYATVTGLLRSQLGYRGVVISDGMEMKAITDQYGFEFAVEKAIEAGIDILLYAGGGDGASVADRVADHVVSLVQAGTISESRIDESYARISALRWKL
jgi:beta-N-acetylhexosaminidase